MTLPIKGGKVPSPFVGEGVGDECFVSSIMVLLDKDMKIPFYMEGKRSPFPGNVQGDE